MAHAYAYAYAYVASENQALSLQFFLIIVLRWEVVTIFEPKVVAISARNAIMWIICKLCKAIFHTLQHFSTKFLNFTTFKRFFPGIFFTRSKINL